jgi:hypothetical protein
MRVLRDGGEINDDSFPGWRNFLAAHGIRGQESPASVALVRGAQSADY